MVNSLSKPMDVIDELIWQYSSFEQKLGIIRNLIGKQKGEQDG